MKKDIVLIPKEPHGLLPKLNLQIQDMLNATLGDCVQGAGQ